VPQNKKYKTILADVPLDHNQRGNFGAINHYPLMSLEQLKSMPIKDLADENCHLWYWFTNGTLRHALDVISAWGFEEKGILTWVKMRMGLGNYLRNATEHVLLATRGKAPPLCKNQLSWFVAPLQEHSHKPEETFAIIERLSPGPYLELFARRKQPGWHSWGLECPGGSDITIPGYPVPPKVMENRTKGGQE